MIRLAQDTTRMVGDALEHAVVAKLSVSSAERLAQRIAKVCSWNILIEFSD
jgi:hypothetical protein